MEIKIEKNLTNRDFLVKMQENTDIGKFDHIVNSGLENNVEYIMFLEEQVNVLGTKVDNLNDLLLLRENKHHNDLIEAFNSLNVLKEENQRLHTELSQKVDYIHEMIEIEEQLKQQLHDLPNKIVKDIRDDMSKRIMEKQIKWGNNIQIDFICNAINECLDTILKKYGVEDERE